ncbi:MAG: STAS domain-containing protein [Candidatus Aminicenantes bacterium]|nr:STAS domain-containing protein [Candidatus Aminicenantes bacterium]
MNVKTAKNKISLDGDLILENAEKGKKLLLAALEKIDGSNTVAIDLEKVNEIDSSGFQLLLAFIRTLKDRDTDCELKKVRKEIADLVILSGLKKFIKIKAEEATGYK